MARTINLDFDRIDTSAIADFVTSTHNVGYDVAVPAFEQAIGYLSIWGCSGHDNAFAHLRIYLMPTKGEITACYYNGNPAMPDTRMTYVMGGMWNAAKNKFTFNS